MNNAVNISETPWYFAAVVAGITALSGLITGLGTTLLTHRFTNKRLKAEQVQQREIEHQKLVYGRRADFYERAAKTGGAANDWTNTVQIALANTQDVDLLRKYALEGQGYTKDLLSSTYESLAITPSAITASLSRLAASTTGVVLGIVHYVDSIADSMVSKRSVSAPDIDDLMAEFTVHWSKLLEVIRKDLRITDDFDFDPSTAVHDRVDSLIEADKAAQKDRSTSPNDD